jgi:hypothetical protein
MRSATIIFGPLISGRDTIVARMAIARAFQQGAYVYALDESGRQLFAVPAGSGKEDGLVAYTANSVSVKSGVYIYTYNEKGRLTGKITRASH